MSSVAPIIQGFLTATGIVIAAVLTATLGVRSYREQKRVDRENYREQKDIDRNVELIK